jgi:hypothetical protein
MWNQQFLKSSMCLLHTCAFYYSDPVIDPIACPILPLSSLALKQLSALLYSWEHLLFVYFALKISSIKLLTFHGSTEESKQLVSRRKMDHLICPPTLPCKMQNLFVTVCTFKLLWLTLKHYYRRGPLSKDLFVKNPLVKKFKITN